MAKSALVALFHGTEQLFEICEREIPSLRADEVLVQVSLATICGSDLHTVSGRRAAPTPCVLGHEIVGIVAAPTTAIDVYGQLLREGDRVTWSIMASCGTCYYCDTKDLPQKCKQLFKYGHARTELSGGFAEYIVLKPGTAIYRLPDSVSDAEAVPLNCALSTVLSGLEIIGVKAEESAIVQGAGMLGIYAACYLREQGYEMVAVVDTASERLQIAQRFGATHTFNLSETSTSQIEKALRDLTKGRGVDLAVEVSGAASALTNSLDWLGIGGRCLTLGYVYPNVDVALDAHKIVTKCLTIRGNHNYHPSALGAAIRFVENTHERYPFAALIGASYPLREIDAAFDRAKQRDLIRVAVHLSGRYQ